jgi:DNA-binding XRE family transcriptional regulator
VKITNGEGWWLIRRRSGKTMGEWAAANWSATLALSEDRLRDWERGRIEAPSPGRCHRWPALSYGEYSALMRRRKGWTLPEVAKKLGVSRQTVWKAEHDRTSFAYDVARYWAGNLPVPVPGAGLRIRAPRL